MAKKNGIISNLDNKIKLRFISEFLIKLSNF